MKMLAKVYIGKSLKYFLIDGDNMKHCGQRALERFAEFSIPANEIRLERYKKVRRKTKKVKPRLRVKKKIAKPRKPRKQKVKSLVAA